MKYKFYPQQQSKLVTTANTTTYSSTGTYRERSKSVDESRRYRGAHNGGVAAANGTAAAEVDSVVSRRRRLNLQIYIS